MVQEVVQSPLAGWASFYLITGSAAAALTGLQFVVMALITETTASRDINTIDAFSSPTIVHFCFVLLVSAMLNAPWQELSSVALALGVSGVAGAGYALLVTRRARRQKSYRPVLEDWIWHSALPLSAYVAILIAGAASLRHVAGALFTTAAAVMLLMFVGIHNAWDSVTYITVRPPSELP
jgi:hypothetical protein